MTARIFQFPSGNVTAEGSTTAEAASDEVEVVRVPFYTSKEIDTAILATMIFFPGEVLDKREDIVKYDPIIVVESLQASLECWFLSEEFKHTARQILKNATESRKKS